MMTNLINHSALRNPAPSLPQHNTLLQMPQDILTQILNYLPGQEIVESALVCRQWNQKLKDNDVWRVLFYHRFSSVNTTPIQNFRNAYRAIYSNLTKGVYASDTFQGHRGTIYCLAIFDGKLFSGSDDKTIKVWDLKTGECTATLIGTQSSVYSLAVFDGKLFSGSDDCTIKVWDLITGEYTALTGHEDAVCSLAVFDGKLFSGSDDKTIKVWDLKTRQCTATLTGHDDSVSSPVVFDGKLFSGSSDETIKVWDLKTGECTATLTGHQGSVCSLAAFDGKLFSASDDGTIKVWDLKTRQCTATLTGHEESVLSLAVFDGKLFSASDDCTIKVWDLKTGECTVTLTGHEDSVSSLAIFDGKLFSGSSDFKIKVWDFTADHRNIFREIAHSLEGQQQPVIDALKRFSRMPKTAKHAIYGKVYGNPFANEYPGCAEFAFHNQNGQRATRVEKAQAIRNYLNDQPSKNNPLLLAHLGIQTEKQYSEKLNCRSEYLEKIGILSVEDLKFICSASPHFLKLDTLQILEVEGDFRDNKVKIEAERRKNNLTTLTGQISQLVEDKIQETNTCGVILYEGRCPWVSFQHKLKAFQAKLGEIADKSHTAKSMVEAFHSKNYNGLADQLNGLIEEFQTLDLDYQISKLHIYVNQWGILTAWNNLRAQAVQNLCLLPGSKQSLQKLFQMGE
jgi:WD40 repeat protein